MPATIRKVQPSDAAQLIAFWQKISSEPNSNLLMSPGEFNLTVPEEEEFITRNAPSDNSTFLVAEVDGQIVGELTMEGGHRKGNHHKAILFIAVDAEWRDQGIGSQLMDYAIDWAKKTGVLRRIELAVFARNERGIHVYRKVGFEVEGLRRKVACKDGEYIDDLIMALIW